ncbi:uncharacterized protein LOC130428149 [Triplophysa dalaica]|uniref:uncharacterized protein LOC130428149 n=1 Tax=Triplophysa dalaica TaxID=1582913 RepID=UPI0024E00806|nr:uncharacterized protein LOC130428149 [Triplophysa dalaica]
MGCRTYTQRAVRRQKKYADARRLPTSVYQPGDKVWLSPDIRLRMPCRKLSPCYIGPFPMKRQISEVSFEHSLPPKYQFASTFHVSLLKPFTDPLSSSPTESDVPDSPSPPEVTEEESIYKVIAIMDSHRRGSQLEYLIDWEGIGPKERSRVNRDDVLDPALLEEFIYRSITPHTSTFSIVLELPITCQTHQPHCYLQQSSAFYQS